MANVKQIRFGGTLPTKILFADGTVCRKVYAGKTLVWNPNQYFLILNPSSITANADGGTYDVQVNSYKNENKEPLEYTVTANETYDWVSFTNDNTTKVTSFKVTSDNTYRAGATITASASTVSGTVGQNGGEVTVSPFSFTFTNKNRTAAVFTYKQEESEDKRTLSISQKGGSGNVDYTLTNPTEDWIRINGKTITADENSNEIRNGSVTAVSNDDSSVKIVINITQSAALYEFNISPTTSAMTAEGGTTTVNVTSTKNGLPTNYAISNSTLPEWVTFNDESNVTTFTVSPDSSPRSGATITVTPSTNVINGNVKSAGGDVEFDAFSFAYSNQKRGPFSFKYIQNESGQEQDYEISQTGGTGTDEYTYSTTDSWLTVSNGKVTANAIPTESAERTGTVTIKSKTDPNKVITATVKQAPKVYTFDVSATPLSFTATGGTCNATITSTVEIDGDVSDASYTNPSNIPNWITPSHGTKASSYTIQSDNSERSETTISSGSNYTIEKGSVEGTVDMSGINFTYKNNDRSATLTYKQTDSSLTKSISISQTGGTGNSTNYTIDSPSQLWIIVSDNVVSITKNETGVSRTGTVTATHNTDKSKKIVITITQKAEDIEFTVSPENGTFSVNGETKQSTVTSTINGSSVEYSIDNKTNFDWLTITDQNNKTTFVASANNVYKAGTTTVTTTSSTIAGSCGSTGGTVSLTPLVTYFTGNNNSNEAIVKYTQTGGKATATYTASQPSSSVDVNKYVFTRKNTNDTWLTIDGNTITATQNGKDNTRESIIVVTNEYDVTKKFEINVTQQKATPISPAQTRYTNFIFEISSSSWNPTAAANNKTDGITSKADIETLYDNGEWYVTSSSVDIPYTCDKASSSSEWAYSSDSKVYVSANEYGSQRVSTLTFTQNESNTQKTLSITQQSDAESMRTTVRTEYQLNVSPTKITTFPLSGGTQRLSCTAQGRDVYNITYISGAVKNEVNGNWYIIANGFSTTISPANSWLSWDSSTISTVTVANNDTGEERNGSIKFTHKSDSSKSVTISITQAGDTIETETEYQIISNSNPLIIDCNAITGDANIVIQSRTYNYYSTTGNRVVNSETSWVNTDKTNWTVSNDTNFSGTSGSSTVTSTNGTNTNSTSTRIGSLTYTLSDLTAASGLDSVTVDITQSADSKGSTIMTEYRINGTPTIPTISYTGDAVNASVDAEYQTYYTYQYGGDRYPNSESGWKKGSQSEITSKVINPVFKANGISISANSNYAKPLEDIDSDYTISVADINNFAKSGGSQIPTITYTKCTTTGRTSSSDNCMGYVTFNYHGITKFVEVIQEGQIGSDGTKGPATPYNGTLKSYEVTGTGFSKSGSNNGITASSNIPTETRTVWRIQCDSSITLEVGETKSTNSHLETASVTYTGLSDSRTGTATYTSSDDASITINLKQLGNRIPMQSTPSSWATSDDETYSATVTPSNIIALNGDTKPILLLGREVGSATITFTTTKTPVISGGDKCTCAVTVEEKTISENDLPGPYVEIGGVKWASCNLGAEKPCDYGDYYMWGSTAPNTDDECSWKNYPLCGGTYDTITKYNNNSNYGTVDNKTVLEAEDDAIQVATNGFARMPTQAEFQSLIDNTTQDVCYCDTALSHSGHDKVYGMLFTSTTDTSKKIFIPFSGYRYNSSLSGTELFASLWTSSLYSDSQYAYKLHCYSGGNVIPSSFYNRNYGCVLRGVKNE